MLARRENGKKISGSESSSQRAGRRLGARQIGWMIVAVVAVLFVVLNNNTTEINLVAASPEWPLWVLVLASMGLGFLLAKLTGRRQKDD
jgi:uncharacterized integral membrane protein